MPKMLGQDIVTQDELDNFIKNSHAPLVIDVLETKVQINNLIARLAAVKYALIASAVSLLGTICLAVLVVMY